ncbi:MAG: succinate dehydrogenase, cytochrome b556 subunit [Gammaproteobacteria bacterium]|nr:succinate dehydrogenase, cytochrome b556 subunit [Gammaproteobacteria bacterium]MDE2252138.1 succinate dehydrogenase, cytochrome b556 subunit [Gammaproteobacteria bacterium]
MHERPLSPHLSIYRFMYTMALSILHRITGVWMAFGLCALVYWLMSAAAGEAQYGRATVLLGSAPARIVLLLWLAAFCYHFANGLRHLAWDAGLGLERRAARLSGRIVLALALLAFLGTAYLLFCPRAGFA